jgi:hypothetical protein
MTPLHKVPSALTIWAFARDGFREIATRQAIRMNVYADRATGGGHRYLRRVCGAIASAGLIQRRAVRGCKTGARLQVVSI